MSILKRKPTDLIDIDKFNPTEFFSNIVRVNETSYQDILNTLINKDKNLELKTHIVKPRNLTSLYMYGQYFISKKCIKTGQFILDWIDQFLIYMVSWKRMSRNETVKVLSSAVEQQEQEFKGTRKLTGNFK